jgi:hypothetical protein
MTRLGTPSGNGIIFGTADPTTGAGVEAPIGFQYRNTVTGDVWDKTAAPDTGWAEAGSGGGGGSGNPITLPPVVDSESEDTTMAGNALADASTTEGVLAVMHYTVAGQPGLSLAGETAVIDGRGTFVLNADGTYEAIPLPDYNGLWPVITQQVTNGSDIKIGTITLTFGAVNDAPIASDDARITLIGEAITFSILTTDQDPDGDGLTITLINGGAFTVGVPVDIGNGTVTVNNATTGSVTVTPDALFEGTLSFTYTISDDVLTDTATVTILVGVSNDPMFSAASPISGVVGEANFNFGLTFRGLYGAAYNNGVNVSIPPYSANQGLFFLTNREPWLYDRASALYALYLRTQDPLILDEAIALADTYMAAVNVSGGGLGTFTIVGGDNGANPADIKYLYPIIGVWYEKETDSSVHRARSLAMYNQSLLSYSKTYSAVSAALWTERNTGYAILNCVSAYWLHRNNGDIAAANVALQDAWDYFTMVETMSAASGAPLHGHNQHEGSAIVTPISSPWMYAFLAEAMLQLYRTDPDVRILNVLSGYGDFLLDNAFYLTDENDIPTIQGYPLPAYLVADTNTPETFREGELLDMEHAADVAALIKKIIWAKTELAQSTVAFTDLVADLEFVAGEVFTYWTRTTEGYPRYRVNPPRKFGWWFRNNYSDTALLFTEQVPTLPLALTALTVSGSTQQGSTLTATPGTWDSFPVATLTYSWYRGATLIAGQTAVTYVTQEADIDLVVTCRQTATNTAGANYITSNGTTVVAAGAPEITVHPNNALGTVGLTVEFTATADAAPAATFQWQVNDGGGWANVSEGTGGSGSGNTTTYETEVLAEGDSGDLYRCVFTNVNGSATTDPATLSMVVDQGAILLAGNGEGAALTFDIGAEGHADFVIEGLVMFLGNSPTDCFMGLRHTGNGRALMVQCNNVFDTYDVALGDTQTGITNWATPPILNTWLHVTIQATTTAGTDTVRATWKEAEDLGATRYAVTRANGIENSVQGQQVFIGGLAQGDGNATGARFQYIRARTGNLADGVVDGHEQDTDASGGTWAFWWRFFDAGGGTPGVEDLSGNNRVPTITGGVYADGPVVPAAS